MSSLARPHDAEPCAQGVHVAGLVQLRSIGIDDWSDVRYVHGSSFRTLIGPKVAPEHVDEFITSLAAPEYVDRFGASHLTGAWLDGELAGTVGWRPSHGRVARIEGLFVQPLFTFMGLGSLLLAHAEMEARDAGFSAVTVLTTNHSVPFFMRLGYDVYVQGAGVAHGPSDLPLFLMRKSEAATSPRISASREKPRYALATGLENDAAMATSLAQKPERVLVED